MDRIAGYRYRVILKPIQLPIPYRNSKLGLCDIITLIIKDGRRG